MGKNEIHWAIFSGKTMLPYTIRTTKKQCIQSHLFDRGLEKLRDCESCKKVVVNEYHKEN
jgi:hypothetical protein